MTGWLHSKGEDFIWKVMKDQEPVYIENARLLTQNLINGKYPLAIGTDGATIDNCKQAGGCQSLEEVRGLEYILGHGVSVLKKAPHPNAAAVFANWFLSHDGQEAFKQGIVNTEPGNGQDAHSIRVDVEPHRMRSRRAISQITATSPATACRGWSRVLSKCRKSSSCTESRGWREPLKRSRARLTMKERTPNIGRPFLNLQREQERAIRTSPRSPA